MSVTYFVTTFDPKEAAYPENPDRFDLETIIEQLELKRPFHVLELDEVFFDFEYKENMRFWMFSNLCVLSLKNQIGFAEFLVKLRQVTKQNISLYLSNDSSDKILQVTEGITIEDIYG